LAGPEIGALHRETGDRDRVAPQRLSALLALEELPSSWSSAGNDRSDGADSTHQRYLLLAEIETFLAQADHQYPDARGSAGADRHERFGVGCLFAHSTVDDFVMVAPLQITTFHQVSTKWLQLVQHQSLENTAFQQISTSIEIWFGSWGSEVQILSPRPIISNYLRLQRIPLKPAHLVWTQVV
jgi:hypothetical protein